MRGGRGALPLIHSVDLSGVIGESQILEYWFLRIFDEWVEGFG